MRFVILALLAGICCESAARTDRRGTQSNLMQAPPMTNTTVKVLIIVKPPFVIKDEKTGNYSGLVIKVLDFVAKQGGFKCDITEEKSGIYGLKQKDGSFNGAIGQLVDKKVDLLAADLTITADREEVVDFTTPYLTSRLTLLENVNANNATSANVKYFVARNTVNEQFLKSAKEGRLKEIWTNVKANNGFVDTIEEGVDMVIADPNNMFLEDYVVLQGHAMLHSDIVQISDENLKFSHYAFAVQKGSPLRDSVSVAISRLNEDGSLLPDITAALGGTAQ